MGTTTIASTQVAALMNQLLELGDRFGLKPKDYNIEYSVNDEKAGGTKLGSGGHKLDLFLSLGKKDPDAESKTKRFENMTKALNAKDLHIEADSLSELVGKVSEALAKTPQKPRSNSPRGYL